MNKIDRITVSLPEDQSAFIERLVASGEYGSADDVVRAGIDALRDHDREIEHWLRTEVAETYRKVRSGEMRTFSAEDVREELERRRAERDAAR